MGEVALSGGSSRSNAGDGGLARLSVGGSVTDVGALNGDRSAVGVGEGGSNGGSTPRSEVQTDGG